MRRLLVTGSSGLMGSEVVTHFSKPGCKVHGVDNNMRTDFFRRRGTTRWNQHRQTEVFPEFTHQELDFRHHAGVMNCLEQIQPDVIVHTAAQPSHDRAAGRPFDDFDGNAVDTLNLLEGTRRAGRVIIRRCF